MKVLVLVNNNLSFDTRNKNQITAIAERMEEVHVLVRPNPDETFHLDLPNVTHSFFYYEGKQYPITHAIRESAEELGVLEDLIEVFPLLENDNYYDPTVINNFIDDLDNKMQGDRWAEIRNGVCEPMRDSIAITYPLNLFEVATQWAQEVIKFPADVVFCNNIDTLLCGVAHKKKYGSRLIYNSPDIYCDVKPGIFPRIYRYVLALFEQRFTQYVDIMLAASVGQLTWFKEHYSLKIPCIPIYNCTSEDCTAPYEPKTPEEKLRIYYTGMIYSYKDFESIIDAMKQVDEILLVLRCWPSEQYNRVKKLVEDNNLFHRVRYVDPVAAAEIADVARQDGDIGIFICETENCANLNLTITNKFIEYLRAGLPVIISDLKEHAKIVKEYQCGFILKDNSSESIASIFREAVSDREKLYRMSENSIRVSKNLFDGKLNNISLVGAIIGDQKIINEKAIEAEDPGQSAIFDLQDMERKLCELTKVNRSLEDDKTEWEADKNTLIRTINVNENDPQAASFDVLDMEQKILEFLEKIKSLEEDKKALEESKTALEQTTSWKITKPLRQFRKYFISNSEKRSNKF